MGEKKKYTVGDFERYHNGKMEPKEMHELEKATLEDVFLADALEGYLFSKNPQKETEDLKSRLFNKKAKRSINYNFILRIAAVLILFAGFGYWILRPSPKTESPLAINDSGADQSPDIAAMLQDTVTEAPAPPVKTTPTEENKALPKKKEKISGPEVATLRTQESEPEIAMAQVPIRETDDSGSSITAFAFTDTIDIENNTFINKENDTPRFRSFLRERSAPRSAILRPVDSARLKKLREASTFSEFTTQSPLPEPVGGWKSFDEYLQKNKPKQKKGGTVTMQFVLSLAGYPTKITVVHSTCDDCERVAVRLLRDGPKWKNSLDGRGEITIIF